MSTKEQIKEEFSQKTAQIILDVIGDTNAMLQEGIQELAGCAGIKVGAPKEDVARFVRAVDKIGCASSMLANAMRQSLDKAVTLYADKFGLGATGALMEELEKTGDALLEKIEAHAARAKELQKAAGQAATEGEKAPAFSAKAN